ncbi:spiralin lipoprotein [Spiroplasma phoeniceum]|uniref:spiralin lipoprotein n=1 Tax=Spiroplasma phoeniceum TaxID=47835 RepID=UPI0033651FB6
MKIVLDPIVLSAVQWINKTATTSDFTYDVFKDKDGSELETVNLQDSKVDVYVQIVAAQDSIVVIGNTGYIKVTLPQLTKIEKVDISSREGTIPYSALEIKAANPNATTINELEKNNIEATLVAKVLKIVKDVEAVTAEDYTITNNAQPDDYSKQQEVIILVKAKDTSKYISGKFAFKGYVKAIK